MSGRSVKVGDEEAGDSGDVFSTRELILDAARQMLVEEGLPGLTTRRIARKAGVNQALVHYHFGSTENLMIEVLHRLAASLRIRQNDTFTAPGDLAGKWRSYVKNLTEIDIPQGTAKVWLEVVAVICNSDHGELFIDAVGRPWYERIRAAVQAEFPDPGHETTVDALTGLITTVYRSIIIDRLLGWDRGHAELVDLVATILSSPPGVSSER